MLSVLHNINVISFDDQWITLLKKGTPLPGSTRVVIRVNKPILSSPTRTFVELPIIEADTRNEPGSRLIGKIEIEARRSRMEIPQDSSIALACMINAQYLIEINVYIREINYGTKISLDLKGPDTSRADLLEEYEKQLLLFGSLRKMAEQAMNRALSDRLTEIYQQEFLDLSVCFHKPDPWDLVTCYTTSTRLKDLKRILDEINRDSDELGARSLIIEFYSRKQRRSIHHDPPNH